MNKKKQEPPEFPKVRYTGIGIRTIDGEEFLRSKAGQRLLDRAMKISINSDAKSKSSNKKNQL